MFLTTGKAKPYSEKRLCNFNDDCMPVSVKRLTVSAEKQKSDPGRHGQGRVAPKHSSSRLMMSSPLRRAMRPGSEGKVISRIIKSYVQGMIDKIEE